MAQTKLVKCTINGEYTETMVDVRASLTDMLRNDFRLTSVKKGCERLVIKKPLFVVVY